MIGRARDNLADGLARQPPSVRLILFARQRPDRLAQSTRGSDRRRVSIVRCHRPPCLPFVQPAHWYLATSSGRRRQSLCDPMRRSILSPKPVKPRLRAASSFRNRRRQPCRSRLRRKRREPRLSTSTDGIPIVPRRSLACRHTLWI